MFFPFVLVLLSCVDNHGDVHLTSEQSTGLNTEEITESVNQFLDELPEPVTDFLNELQTSVNQFFDEMLDDSSKENSENLDEEEQQEAQDEADDDHEVTNYEEEVITLTNEEREAHGLSPLELDNELAEVATVKSEDMRENDYFSHQSPAYGSPFDLMDAYDVDYMIAGENIAMGQESPEQVVNAWMESEGHRENILREEFTHIGIGHVEQDGLGGGYWTQMFLGK